VIRARIVAMALISIGILLPESVRADGQTEIPNYATASSKFFYQKLYPQGGFTLYCGAWFAVEVKKGGKFIKSPGLNIEHIYPANWMLKHAGCGDMNRTQCQASGNVAFNHMEADLHNLYPSTSFANGKRSNHTFDIIKKENWVFEDCDFEFHKDKDTKKKTVEPRPQARGNIARAIMYMHWAYGLPVEVSLRKRLMEWNTDDPVSDREKWRNKRIKKIQGNRNPFIDDPSKAASLGW
jgi:deoxyribonuclease I